MRDKNILLKLDEICVLVQYLYMSEEHLVEYDNGVGTIIITLDENLDFFSKYKNRVFKNLQQLRITSDVNLRFLMEVIEQLKKQTSDIKNFKNKWEEIMSITRHNMALNFV